MLERSHAKAILFVTYVSGTWECIGYVVQEILDEIHKAMDDNLILKVQHDSDIHTLLQTSTMVCRNQNNKKRRMVAGSCLHFSLILSFFR